MVSPMWLLQKAFLVAADLSRGLSQANVKGYVQSAVEVQEATPSELRQAGRSAGRYLGLGQCSPMRSPMSVNHLVRPT